MKIYVCDDQDPKSICEKLAESEVLNGPTNSTVTAFTESKLVVDGNGFKDLTDAIQQLFEAVDKTIKTGNLVESPFDGADVILLDYGLTALERPQGGPRLTADLISGNIRAFTDSPYVVSLNRLKDVNFDLRYLVGDFESKADAALNTENIAEPGLWTGEPQNGNFCPWYWPRLLHAADRRRKQIAILIDALDNPLLPLLGIPDDQYAYLSRRAIGFLSPQAEDVREVTAWRHFRYSSRTLSKDDRKELVGGDAAFQSDQIPENPVIRKIVARVVAGELDYWFRRDLLGPQNVLIDVPHLQARYPFRNDAIDDLAAWNETARSFDAEPYGLDSTMFKSMPKDAGYLGQPWLDRPAFWVSKLERDNDFNDQIGSMTRNTALVFCEDTRRFCRREQANRFVTEIGQGIDVRYVEQIGDGYSPMSAFAR